jgi:hypothetical protein
MRLRDLFASKTIAVFSRKSLLCCVSYHSDILNSVVKGLFRPYSEQNDKYAKKINCGNARLCCQYIS